jgi:hypothetical protein
MVADLEGPIKRFSKYKKWENVKPVDFESIVDADIWAEHWKNCEELHEDMRKSQELAIVF